MTTIEAPEFSRPITIGDLESDVERFDVSASDEERADLARRLGILSIERLEATVHLSVRLGGLHAGLSGDLSADVWQACVVTLEPVPATVEAHFERTFGPQDNFAPGAEVMISMEEEDPPDPMETGVVDIGEVVAEELSLALNPFPRVPGAEFDSYSSTGPDATEEEQPAGPFARLAELKRE